jgi:hypothetical protein
MVYLLLFPGLWLIHEGTTHAPVVKPAIYYVDSGQVFDRSAEGLPTLPLISGKWDWRAVNEFA